MKYKKEEVECLSNFMGAEVMSTLKMAMFAKCTLETINGIVSNVEAIYRSKNTNIIAELKHDILYTDTKTGEVDIKSSLVEWPLFNAILGMTMPGMSSLLRDGWIAFHFPQDVPATCNGHEIVTTKIVIKDNDPKPDIVTINGEFGMTSLRIAEKTGKQHYNVMRDIKKMLNDLEIDALRFEGIYKDAYNRDAPMYILTERETMILASGYDVKLRAKIIDELAELKKQAVESTLPDFNDRVLMARVWADEVEKKEAALLEIKKKDISISRKDDLIMTASKMNREVGEITVSELSKSLGIKDFGTNTCYAWLRDKGYLMKNGEPYQRYIASGYFKHKPWKDDLEDRARYKPIFTAKGSLAIASIILKEHEELIGDIA
jgi:anti-repressor protein